MKKDLKVGDIIKYNNVNSFGIILKIEKDLMTDDNLYFIDIFYETTKNKTIEMKLIERNYSIKHEIKEKDYRSSIKLIFNYQGSIINYV